MTTSNTGHSVSRRTALAGLGAGGLGLALATRGHRAAAQEATPDALATHPIVGVWNAMTPGGPSLATFLADGSATFANPPTAVDPARGVIYLSPSVGTWEPTGPRGIHFTATLVITDANGTHVGYQTNDAYPVVSEDGQTLLDDQSQGQVTIRDAAGVTVQAFATAGAPPVTGTRMGVGAPGFPADTPTAATPTT
jgi:hypothetical protein